MARKRNNIPAFCIRGEQEFFEAFGIKSPDKQAEMRSQGMPHYSDGRIYIYFPEEVKAWIRENYKVQEVNIKGL